MDLVALSHIKLSNFTIVNVCVTIYPRYPSDYIGEAVNSDQLANFRVLSNCTYNDDINERKLVTDQDTSQIKM